jgi:hypothetical protein
MFYLIASPSFAYFFCTALPPQMGG